MRARGRRPIVALVAALALFGSGAQAEPQSVSARFVTGNVQAGIVYPEVVEGYSYGGHVFAPMESAPRFVEIHGLHDAAGLPVVSVAATVCQDLNGDLGCGDAGEPYLHDCFYAWTRIDLMTNHPVRLPFRAGVPTTIVVYANSVSSCTADVEVTGTIAVEYE